VDIEKAFPGETAQKQVGAFGAFSIYRERNVHPRETQLTNK
jgi:hypothetical protein